MRRVITLFVLFLTLGLARSANAQDIITTVAGGGPNNVPAVSANIDNPIGVAFDAAGNLFISVLGNNRIFKVDTSGQLTLVAGIGNSPSPKSIGTSSIGCQASSPQHRTLSPKTAHRTRSARPLSILFHRVQSVSS